MDIHINDEAIMSSPKLMVEAAANLANPIWSPLATDMLTGGSSCFSDARWTNYHGRFYRLSSQ